MKIEYINTNNVLKISLIGELDECAADYIRESIDALIDAAVCLSEVTLDLSGVCFMDSTGVGVIIGRYKKLKAKGVRLSLSQVSSAVDRVFKIAGIYQIIGKVEL